MTKEKLESEIDRIVYADHNDPFSVLGMHKQLVRRNREAGGARVPAAGAQGRRRRLARPGRSSPIYRRCAQEGFFAGPIPGRKQAFRYRLRLLPYGSEETYDIEDPYRFGPVLGELDIHLLVEGTHLARVREARRAHRRRSMASTARPSPSGHRTRARSASSATSTAGTAAATRCAAATSAAFGRLFVPGVGAGDIYKYELKDRFGNKLAEKADPFAAGSGDAAEDRLDRPRSDRLRRGDDGEWMRSRARTTTTATRRSPSTRSISARGSASRRKAIAISPIASWPTSWSPTSRTWASPTSS